MGQEGKHCIHAPAADELDIDGLIEGVLADQEVVLHPVPMVGIFRWIMVFPSWLKDTDIQGPGMQSDAAVCFCTLM